MSLNKIQKTFVRLATNQQHYWMSVPYYRSRKRRLLFKKWQPHQVKVEVINAVTGEKTTAKTFEDSPAKLKKWLKLRNIRAEFQEMLLKKHSTFFKLNDEEFENYPVIVKVGNYKVPYIIAHITDRVTYKGRATCTVLLQTTDNVNFLEVIAEKKELLEKSVTPKKSIKRKRSK